MSHLFAQFKCQAFLFDPLIRPLLGVTTLGQSRPGSDSNEGVLPIPQSSSITGVSPSDCFMLYPGHLLWGGGFLPSAMRYQCILQPQPTGLMLIGQKDLFKNYLHLIGSSNKKNPTSKEATTQKKFKYKHTMNVIPRPLGMK